MIQLEVGALSRVPPGVGAEMSLAAAVKNGNANDTPKIINTTPKPNAAFFCFASDFCIIFFLLKRINWIF